MTVSSKHHLFGTHRVCSPEATWERLSTLLGPAGITRVADITGFDVLGIPVFQAMRPRSRSLTVSQGKGLTPLLSKISAVMESLELLHAEDVVLERTRASVGEMRALVGYDLDSLPRRSLSAFNDTIVLDWLPARHAGSDQLSYIPLQLVDMSFTVPSQWEPFAFRSSTSGLCAGNTEDEALAHGLYELIERDCVYGDEHTALEERRHVDFSTINGESARLLERFLSAGNEMQIIDVSNDLGVPCYHVLTRSPNFPMWSVGSGAHLDPDIALDRALTEAAQSRVAAISGTREDQVAVWQQFEAASISARVEPQSCVAFDPVSQCTDDVAADAAELLTRVRRRGPATPILVDLTRPEFGIPVAKLVISGLGEPAQH